MGGWHGVGVIRECLGKCGKGIMSRHLVDDISVMECGFGEQVRA